MGSTSVKAASPAYGNNSIRISSVPYALDDIASGERTPSATGFDSRSDFNCSVISGLPRTSRFSEYPTDSGVVDRPAPDVDTTPLLCQPPGADDNDAFGLDYAELSAVEARRQLAAALLNAADELGKVLSRLYVG